MGAQQGGDKSLQWGSQWLAPTKLPALITEFPVAGIPQAPTQTSSQPVLQMGTLRGEEACLGHRQEETASWPWGGVAGREGAKAAPQAGRAPCPPECGNHHLGSREETAIPLGAHGWLVKAEEAVVRAQILKLDPDNRHRPVNLFTYRLESAFSLASLPSRNPAARLHLAGSWPTAQSGDRPHL